MLYSILVCAQKRDGRNLKVGEIIAYKAPSLQWGKREGPPRFNIISYDCTEDEIKYIQRECIYDFNNKIFIDKDTLDPFKKSDAIISADYNDFVPGDEQSINLLGHDVSRERSRFAEKYSKFKNLPGVKNLIYTIKHNNHASIYICISKLPTLTKVLLKSNMSPQDYDELFNKWRVS